jgi:uncharacterized protein
MGAAEHKATLQNMFAELAKGNGEALLDALDDKVQWTIIGTTSLSKTYDGKQDVIEGLLAPFGVAIDGHIQITPENYIAEGDYVALQGRGESRTKSGVDYNNSYCWVYKFRNGKIVSIVEYLDTELVRTAFG